MKTEAVAVIIVLILGFVVLRALTTHFVCPRCGKKFKVNTLNYIFAPHMMFKRMVKCPGCGYTDFMMPEWDKKQ